MTHPKWDKQTAIVPTALHSEDKQCSRFTGEHLSFRDCGSFVGKLKRRYEVEQTMSRQELPCLELPRLEPGSPCGRLLCCLK